MYPSTLTYEMKLRIQANSAVAGGRGGLLFVSGGVAEDG
jgi:hypothetical protein